MESGSRKTERMRSSITASGIPRAACEAWEKRGLVEMNCCLYLHLNLYFNIGGLNGRNYG
jgi:hypothetical protein